MSFATHADTSLLSPLFSPFLPLLLSLDHREKKRKRAAASGTGTGAGAAPKPDKAHVTTVNMVCCLVLSLPYDLPAFGPALVAALVQHSDTPGLSQVVKKTVLDFKRTHQDRWEEFKGRFSNEALADLSGASDISYLS